MNRTSFLFGHRNGHHNTKLGHIIGQHKKYNSKLIYHIKIVEIVKLDTPNTQRHDCSLSWLSAGTSVESDQVKLVLWAQASSSLLSEMML